MKFYLKHYKSQVPNARKSLNKPVSIQTLLGNIKHPLSIRNSRPLENYSRLYFWDLGKRASEIIAHGDALYIVMERTLYFGVIEFHIEDPQGGIGDAIGWALQYKKPWINPIGFKEIQVTDLNSTTVSIVEDAMQSAQVLAKNFYLLSGKLLVPDSGSGFVSEPPKPTYRIRKNREQKPKDPGNSIEGHSSITSVTNFELPAELRSLVSKLNLLKSASHHSEREHESLVERFFEYLGYQYPQDIKYRVGHIDILVNEGSSNSIVVEVKRNWDLNRENKEVVDQAFRYATNNGSRFVAITNGDYYAFYDRLRGLSINDNFDFDFRLSEIRDREIQLLKKYRKENL